MIKVNDKQMDFNGTLAELIVNLSLNADTCAILVNGDIVKKENWNKTYLKEGDYVEVVSFVGGG